MKRSQLGFLMLLASLALVGVTACGDDDSGSNGGGSGGGGGGSGGSGGDCLADDPCTCPKDGADFCVFCPNDPTCVTPAVCDTAGLTACHTASECPNATSFACVNECCIELCGSNQDCAARPECTAAALGCVCDEGFCKAKVCSADSECANGQVCVEGGCATAATPATVTRCAVEPRYAVSHEGEPLAFSVKGYAGDTAVVLATGGAVWSATGNGAIDANGNFTGNGTTGPATVTATIGTTTCTADVTNFAAAAAFRVVVTDELTGLPIEGATVVVEGADPRPEQTTDATGAAAFVGLANGAKTVSVFHADFSYVTIVGTQRDDLLLQLRRNIPQDTSGGFKGKFGPAELFANSDVHAGVAGTSIPGNLVDLSFEILLGPSITTIINIGGETPVDLPSGITIGLGAQWFKEEYQALGVPGICSDRAKSEAGTCGTRTAWGVAGGVPIRELPIDEIAGGGGDLNVGQLLATLLPRFQKFQSGVVRDVEFDLAPNLADANGAPLPDFSKFTTANLVASHELALRGNVMIPTLPQLGGQYLTGAIVLGGANTGGRGVVPLGLTAGIDANVDDGQVPDGKVNDADGNSTGELVLRMAPLHSGLEGSDYGVIALAVNLNGLFSSAEPVCTVADRSGCTALAGVVKMQPAFAFDSDVTFAGFVGFEDNATFTAATRMYDPNGAVPNANVYRVNMKSAAMKEWNVFYGGANSFALPAAPAGFEDRSAAAALSVQSMKVEGTDLDGLVDFDSTNLSNLVDVTSAFSTVDLPMQ